ncbi:DoxX family protein [Specibacter cremeus]|uniref:DoxX family protein n=1 Tax=Specibacter cremeus TaxID=1629051 RepID=UPI000F776907|nr:DoxX family protein [Specibacter cremeus]
MNVILWTIASVLAVAFLGAGAMKLLQPKAKLAVSGMGWTQDFAPAAIKAIGLLELLAVVGLILPGILHIAPVLVPLAAVGLVALMVGAAVTHARRREPQMIIINVVLLVLAAVVVWGRFGPYAFTT